MFDRMCTRGKAGGLDAASARRHIGAWLAILGLYVQLFAAGLCTAGSPLSIDASSGNLAAFPICHTPGSSDQSAPAQGPAPVHHACPFCALHCKAAMVMAPSVGAPERFVAISTPATQALFIVPAPARYSAGASPRGPPASA
ncbi:MAG TPA: DUF2946 family protein [Methylovirgula sp.]|nr:DUF2946 family protein [Methylovirgula sp.]